MDPDRRDQMSCPTCGARQGWADACRRCKCDLRLLRAAAAAYDHARSLCLEHLRAGHAARASRAARACHRLRPDAESGRLLALAHLIRGRFSLALDQARRASLAEDDSGHA
jgi:hypothetical protein